MTHPNIVKYIKTFLEGEWHNIHVSQNELNPQRRKGAIRGAVITILISLLRLILSFLFSFKCGCLCCVVLPCTLITGDRMYIVMELIEGVSLSDHFTSLKEKQQQFSEGRVWNIFIQVKLAIHICIYVSF